MNTNIKLRRNYNQVCVWPGTLVEDDKSDEFINWAQEHFNSRIQFLETIKTGPDRDENGHVVEGTGGRSDVFFAVHRLDVAAFAIPRLDFGIRWIEDAVSEVNGGNRLYPDRVNDYCSW